MAQVKVSTPVPGYSGSVGAVVFADGVAMVDEDAAEMSYLRTAGYLVESVEDEVAEPDGEAGPDAEPMPAKNASTEVWRNWAVDHGGMSADEAGELSRDELVARFAEVEENS